MSRRTLERSGRDPEVRALCTRLATESLIVSRDLLSEKALEDISTRRGTQVKYGGQQVRETNG